MDKPIDHHKLLNYALILSFITIGYNVIEGIISVAYGLSDDTLVLVGFGVDSFVEVISGMGIAHMILRMRYTKIASHDSFERTALRITGVSFYLLTAGLIAGAIINIWHNKSPETTVVGIIISSISILTMWWIMTAKKRTGEKLGSDAIVADANCTRTCFYLSILLLVSSGIFEIFQIGWIDAAGSLGIAWFAFSEGREAFEKANSEDLLCCGSSCHT